MSEQTAYIDLDFLPPIVERLAALPDMLKQGGYSSVVLKIIDNFPWVFDRRMQSSTAYPESIIAYAAEKFEKHGIRFSFIFPGKNDFNRILRLNGYRRLVSDRPGIVTIDTGRLEFLPLIESLAEDYLSLCPDTYSLIIDGCGGEDEKFFKRCEAGVVKIRKKFLVQQNVPGYKIAEEYMSAGGSGLPGLSKDLNQDVQDFASVLFKLKHYISMSSLSSNSPAASRENLESIFTDLYESKKSA